MAVVTLLYRRYVRNVETSGRYAVGVSENVVATTQTQTDLTFRQRWNHDENRWERGRFFYGFTACVSVIQCVLWRPVVVLKQMVQG